LFAEITRKDPIMSKPLRSSNITQGVARAPNRSMYYALGYTEDDFNKPMIGIANGQSTITPCNSGLQPLADAAAAAVKEAGGNPQMFGTPTISDGMAMGTEGMKYSLVSREVIADCVETCVQGQWMDGVLVIGGCDKNMPGGMMGMLRANVPSIYVYGGTILPGTYNGKDLNIVSVFEAVGEHAAGRMSEEDLRNIETHAIPCSGSCGGMYTANTMSSAFEVMGMSLPYSSTMANVHKEKLDSAAESARVLLKAVELDLKPRDIVTRKSIENAVAVIMATGGSTNAVLHLIAMAHTVGVQLTLEDFTRIGKRVPVLADLRPSGHYMMSELVAIGGIQPLMKTLLDAGLLHGGCLTVTGKTLTENLASVAPYPDQQRIIHALDDPIKKDSHLRILYGNLAPTGAVAKITGKEGVRFTGRARVCASEEEATAKIMAGTVQAGDVLVIRYEGPRGGPGMREMLTPTSAIMGRGLGKTVALITDGRFSGGSHGFVVGHITPEAQEGGPIALVEEGDEIIIDGEADTIDVNVAEPELQARRQRWRAPAPRYTRGVLSKYAKSVSSASLGAVTDAD
jgi:dihydroxy-acid dehydratase